MHARDFSGGPSPTGPGRPALLAVHGLGGSALNWVDLASHVGDVADVLAVDLPGFGASPPPRDGDYSPRGHARRVAHVAREWRESRGDGKPIHIIGNSLGGAVAVQLAAAEPELVASVTLISPALPTRRVRRGSAHLPVIALPGVGESLLRRYRRVDAAARVHATMTACFADLGRVNPHVNELIVAEVRERDRHPYAGDAMLSSLRGLLRTFMDPSGDRPWSLARRLRQPVLAIYGTQDVLVDVRSAKVARAALGADRVVVLDDCGHVAQMEHPERVARLWTTRILGPNALTGKAVAP